MILTSPLYVDLPRKTKKDKRVYLNLNVYPNLHYQTYNQAKIAYKEELKNQLEGLKLKTPIRLNFTLWRKDRRVGDRANVLAVVEKFFNDALKEWGCIEDDNDGFIVGETYRTGGVDKNNPRVDIEIIES
ncbi:MAG: hypothetical protein PHQ46_10700 [Negativicutes bacterium]|nr:hypothetical protein [Negativicutes bacterium]